MIFWKKGSNLCVIFKKLNGSILCVIFKKLNGSIHKKINSVGRIQKFNSVSYFWLMKNFESWKKKVHFFESKIFKKKFKYLSHVNKKVQFFESCEKGPSIWIMKKKGWSNSLSQIEKKKFNSLSHIFNKKKSSIFWVISKKGSILWVFFFFKKKTQYLK